MADNKDPNNNENKLNDAVEQQVTPDAGTDSQQANTRNQQSTAATAAATAAGSEDAAAQANQAMAGGPSGAGEEGESGGSGSSAASAADTGTEGSSAAQSKNVDGSSDSGGVGADTGGGSGGGASATVGSQAVGGDTGGSDGGAEAEGATQAAAAAGGAAPAAASSGTGAGEGEEEEFDSETTSEQFEVNVADGSDETTGQTEDDFDSETTSSTFEIQVEDVNDAPEVEQDLAYIMDEDGTITFTQEQLLEYASDVEGDDLTASNLSVGENASVTDNGDGTFTVIPDQDFNGELDVTFDISDGQETVTSNIDLTVRPINDAPEAGITEIDGTEDTAIVFTQEMLLQTATDIDSDELTALNLQIDEEYGTVVDNGDGTFTFTPTEDYNGDVPFTFDVDDNDGAVTQATGNVNLAAVNDTPVLAETSYEINEDGSILITESSLLENATDIDGDQLSITDISSDENGTVTQTEDGDWLYTPNEDYSGDANLSITVNDGTVDAVFDAPVTVTADADEPSLTVSLGDMTLADYGQGDDSVLTGWQTDNVNNAIEVNPDWVYGAGDDRGDVIELEANRGDESNLFTDLDAEAGEVISLSFDMSGREGHLGEDSQIDVYFEGELIDTIVPEEMGWNSFNYELTATTDNPRLEFDSPDDNSLGGLLDNISVTKMPSEDNSVPIRIDSSVTDLDGSESLQSLVIDEIPDGATITDGTNTFTADGDNDSADVLDWDLDNLSFQGAENFNGPVSLNITSTSVEDSNGDTASTSTRFDFEVMPVNDAPEAEDKAYTIEEDGSLTFTDEQLLENATDIDGDDLSVSGVSYTGTDGVLSDNGDGTYTFSPNENFNGDVDFTFDVTDGIDTVTANIDVQVTEVNDPPVAGPTSYTINEDEVLTFSESQILANASDIDGEVVSLEINYDGPDGIFTVNGDGTCSFAPNENFNGEVQLNVTVTDDDGATVDTVINVDVLPINDPPVSGSTSYQVNEDGSITISQDQLLSQSSDVEGDDLTASNLTVDGNAEVTINEDGSFTITPDADWNGDIDLSYDISDGTDTIQGTADLTVNPVNDLPQPQDQAFTVEEDGTLTFTDADLLTGATDIEGDDLSVEGVTYSGTDGILTDNGDGTYSFAPNENFNGDVEFTFDVSDGTDTVTANVDVSVTPVDDAPTVEGNLSYTVNEDGEITLSQEQLLSNVSDVEGDDLTASNLTVDGNAQVTVNDDGSFTITPDADWNGDIDISFDVSDGENIIASGADLTVNPVNDLPQPQDQAFSVEEDGTLTFTDADLLTGATDIEGDDLSVEGVNYSGTDGILTDNGDGTYSFAPNENFNGDVEFTFDVSDGTDTVTANVDVSVTPVNDAPTVEGNLSYTVNEDGEITLSQEQLLSNVSDIDGGDLTASNLSVSGNADVTVNDDGSFTITPDADWNGDIDISFDVSDGENIVASGADLTVNPVNDLPQPEDQAFSVEEDGTLIFSDADLLTGASDIEGDDLSVEGVSYSGTDGILTDNGDGTYSFAPNENFNGDVEFSFDVSDGTDTVSANIDVSVTPVDDAPVSGDLAYSVNEDGQITLSQEQLLSQASDVEGDDLTASNLSVDGNADVTVNSDGSFTITPDADWNGDIDISFDISDGSNIVQAQADLTVNPVNDLPQPEDQAFTIEEDGILTFTDADLLTGATDIDGDDLSIDGVSYTGTDGILTDNGNGTYSFAPNENFNGDVEFSFDVSDGTDVVTASVDVSVTPVDDAPVSGDLAYSVNEDGEITLSQEQLLSQASDVEGDDLTASNLSVDGNAEVTVNDDGSFTITPDADWNGDIDISFDISDGNNVVQAQADLTVNPVNDLPQPEDQAFTMEEDGTLTFTDADLLTGATDIDGDDLSVEGVSYTGTDGILTDNGDGTYSFAPNENFNGDVEFSFDVSDGTDTVTANVDVSVTPVDDAPTVEGNLSYTVNEDGEITLSQEQLLSNVSDVEGDDLTASNLSVDGNAEVTVNDDGSFTITPDADWNGDIDISFDVSDGENLVQSGADLTVNPVNDLPQPQDQEFTVEEDGILTFTDAHLLQGATDIEGDDLTVEGISYSGTDGILTDNGNGTYSFAPNENFNGDVEFSFDVSDGTDTVTANIDVSVTPVDDAPTVEGNLSYTVNEDGEITLSQEQLLSNVTDVEGDDLTASNLSVDGNAEVTVNDDGSFTITPDADWNGDIDISFDVSDGENIVASGADLTVNPVNDLPQPQDQEFTIQEDGILTFTDAHLLQGATDIEGDDLSVEGISYSGTDGILTDNGNGTYSFAPNENFNGDVEFSFEVSDGTDTVTANVDVSVTPVDDAPTVEGNLSYTVNEDGEITLSQEQLLSNVTDVEGDELTASNLSVDGNAEVTVNDDGSFTITPDADWNGDIDISFDVSDGENIVASGADLTVNPVNDLPQPQDQEFTIEEDGILTFTDTHLLQGATDIEGDDLSVEGISYSGTDGILTDNGNGTYSFAPNENFNGDVEFTFEVSDGIDTVSANVDVSVTPVDDAPVSGELAYTVNEDGEITLSQEQLLSQASDVEGDDLTASNLSVDGNAQVTANDDGSFTITPDADWNGDIDISFDISDGENVVQAGADLTVNPVNDLPQAEDKSYTVEEDGTLTFTDEQLLENATDIDGDELSVEGVSYTGADGVLTDNGDGTYSFAPNENFNGEVEFSFDVSDGTETVTANIDVSVTEVNDPPVAGSTSYTVQEDNSITISDEQLLANSSDIEGDVSVEDVSYSGTDGVLADNGDGTYTFSPNENFSGDISLDVTVVDEDGATDTTTAGIEVIEVNDPPIAGPTSYTIDEDSVLTFSESQILANASDIDGEVTSLEINYDGPDGIFTVNGDGTCSFAPNENFNGEVQLNVTVTDDDGATTETVINVDVLPINDAPVSGDTAYQVDEDGSITISQEQLLSQASDIEGDDLTASNLTVDGNAEVTVNEDGSFTITPDADWNGDIDMSFDITDGTDTIQASADLTVNPVNDLPQPEDQAFTVEEDGTLTFTDADLLTGATDIDGDDLSVEGVNYSGTDGILTDNGDGTYSFAPNENFNGDVEFSFDVSDGTDTVTANIDVSVTPVDDAPTVEGSLSYTVNEDGEITLSQEQLLSNVSDVEGDDLTASNLTVDGNADVTVNDDGSFTITPDADWNGDIDISFDVSDGENIVASGADLTVNPVNDLPQPEDQAFTVEEDGTLTFTDEDLLTGATDIEGDDLSVEGVNYSGTDGILTDNGDGTYSFAPNENFNGDVEFTFDVSDGTDTVTANVDVSVTPVNDAPTVEGNLSYTVNEDGEITLSQEQLLANTSDIDGGDLTASNLSVSGNAEVTANEDGSFTITPDADWNGDIDISFDINDGENIVESGADLTVNPVNDLPQPEDQAFTMEEDGTLTFTDADLLTGATDIDGDDLSVESVNYSGTDGILTDNGDGTYSFAPNENFNGDVEFSFDVSDGTDTVTANVDVSVTPVDDAPVSGDLAYSVNEDGEITLSQEQLLSQASDVEGDDLTASNLSVDGNAEVTVNDDGSFTITPDADWNGDIDISFDISDGSNVVQAQADLTVNPVNDLPQPED
ncbi:tandem-95 repeat protein, partial [Vibrio sp. WXL103]|uniref:tandem-95 repeat protein n=1 Tax=Vibrio sp. WXL103 TaxID=3450710 RepID=UPI003EC7E75E